VSVRNANAVRPDRPRRVAIVIANPAMSSTTSWPVGFWFSELTHPYFLMTEAGYDVRVFSPFGGRCVPDTLSDPRDASGYSETDLISMGFVSTPRLAGLIDATLPVADLDVDSFDAIMVAGGQAPMFAYDTAVALQRKFVEFYERGKIACALCHGVAILRYAKLGNGEYLVRGKTVTGFANCEEDFADEAVWSMQFLERGKHLMPWRIEDEMKRLDANYIHAGLWKEFATRDGNLITGQQNFSGARTAQLVIEAVGR
jgi:putative intracellular protease/amidase